MSQTYTIHRASFRQGLSWLPASAEMMRGGFRPLLLIAAIWLALSLISFIPLIGQVIIVILTPLITAGVLLAFDRLGEGRWPEPTILFAGWRDPQRRNSLLSLGLFMFTGALSAAVILFGWLGSQLSQEELQALSQENSPEALAEALVGVSIGPGLFLAAVVMGLVLSGLYFSIALVMFGRAPAFGAFVTSIKAVFSNLPAFLGYLLSLIAIGLGVAIILVLVTGFFNLALGSAGAFLSQLMVLMVMMLFQVLLAGAQYLAFAQIFGWSPGLDDEAGADKELRP